MAPQGQGLLWSEVLCCPLCSELFGRSRQPLNLPCGHALCRQCVQTMRTMQCPLDQVPLTIPLARLPVNRALLAVLDAADDNDDNEDIVKLSLDDADLRLYLSVENHLSQMTAYLQRAESERGGSVWSQDLSRPVQRKLVALLCFQLLEAEGRIRAAKTARSLGERALIELLLSHQNSAHLSSNLWSAVRARGCQFLGPAMQEEVLRLILLTLSEGALIARKTLVMYIVQTLSEDYPQVSKTCVGHVVQLLYRASCFNVIKRDGESSLMQLKQEYRDYDSLRREHDAQIVQIAVEAGLRISPDQWSSLLYGDQSHRSHMQSIIDKDVVRHSVCYACYTRSFKLQSPQAFGQSIQELITAVQRNGDPDDLLKMVPQFELLAAIDPAQNGAGPSWATLDEILKATKELVEGHVRFTQRKNQLRSAAGSGYAAQARVGCRFPPPPPPAGQSPPEHQPQLTPANAAYKSPGPNERYKTRLCRDVAAGRFCPRGQRCTYAHSLEEMRQAQHFARHQPRLALRPPIPQNVGIAGPSPTVGMTVGPPPHPPVVMPMETQQPSVAVAVAPGLAVVVPPGTTAQQQQVVAQAQHQVQMQQQAVAQQAVSMPAHMQPQMVQGGVSVILQPQPPPPAGTPVAIPVGMQTVWPPAPPCTIPLAVEASGRVTWVQQWQQPPNAMPPPPMGPPMEMVGPMKQMYATTNGGEAYYALVDDGYGTVSMAPVAALEPTNVAFMHQVHPHSMPPPNHQGHQQHQHQQQLQQQLQQQQQRQIEPHRSDGRGMWELAEEDQLKLRRDEIVNRLAAMQRDRPDHRRSDRPWLDDGHHHLPDEEDGSSHVSFTVATSVLHDAERDAAANLELPPLPLRFNSIISSSVESFTQWQAADWWRPCTSSGGEVPMTSTVRTVCPQPVSWDWSPALSTTVQAPCTVMQVCDTINQPLPTPTIQSNQHVPVASYDMIDPSQIAGQLPPVIRPLPETSRDPQNVVSHSLDLIVDVKERMNDVEKMGIVSAVEKQQLEVELDIVSRQIQSLDRQTKQSCLLKELEAVDKKIEDLNIA